MAKEPADCPKGEIGERCQHRANRERFGTIVAVSEKYPTWCTMKWDNGMRGPRVVHRHELRLLPIDGFVKVSV
jgi:hypothetical protein